MIADDTVREAVERGIFTAEQAERLHALERELASTNPLPQDDEKLRFITGFGDIFVTIGLALFLGALGYLANQKLGGEGMWRSVAVASWLLAELFTRRERMALPSIVLLIVFALGVFCSLASFLEPMVGDPSAARYPPPLFPDFSRPLAIGLAGLATVAAAGLHYWRFRVPITLAAGGAALVAAIVGLIATFAPNFFTAARDPLLVACGLVVFALAMRFDLSDKLRETRRADIAFWLHLLAAPLIVHPLLSGLAGNAARDGATAALPILGTFAALGAIAVLIDRRALLVSGLVYAGIAFSSMIGQAGVNAVTTPFTILALGAFVLVLSAFWHPLRRVILAAMPAGLARRLPHPSIASPS
ncbi:MAG TPA: hypothetical protein VLA00_19240 [Xanthobacteraceae bacterium]|nr:hypothetical protein [Xanthobacteraceae bacterium]